MTDAPRTRSIRCRLSDGVRAATEFTAQDGRTLANGCRRALATYRAQHHGSGALRIQVRPLTDAQRATGWFAPVRGGMPADVFR